MSTSRRSGWWECYRGEVEKHWQSNMKWDWIPFSSFLLHTYKLHRSHRFSSCTTYVHPFRTYRHIGRTINDYLESWTMCTSIGVRSLSVGISLWTYLETTPYRVLINQTVTWLAKHPFTPKYQSSFSGRRRALFLAGKCVPKFDFIPRMVMIALSKTTHHQRSRTIWSSQM